VVNIDPEFGLALIELPSHTVEVIKRYVNAPGWARA
jgi:hypothetical protein